MAALDGRTGPRLVAVALAAALALGAVACGGSSSSSDTTTTSTTAAEATSTTAARATSTTTGSPVDVTEAELEELLLTPAEVGEGFVASELPELDDSTPTACGTPRADGVVPPEVEAAALSEGLGGEAALLQELRVYATEAEAVEAVGVGSEGLACSTGEVDGQQVAISAAVDLTAELGDVDEAVGWELSATDIDAVLVVARAGRLLVNFQFVVAKAADSTGLAHPLDVALAGVGKIRDA